MSGLGLHGESICTRSLSGHEWRLSIVVFCGALASEDVVHPGRFRGLRGLPSTFAVGSQ